MKFFSLDSPVMAFLTKVANLMILNFLAIICCIPIVTGGASITAMYYVTLKMARGEDPYIARNFFKSFKDNFKQATPIWIVLLVAVYALYMDWQIVENAMSGTTQTVIRILLLVVIVVVAIVALYVFPVLSRFDNTIKATIKNALLMGIINLPKTVWMLLIHLLPVVAILISDNMVPVVFMLGLSTIAYLCSRTFVKIFKKYEPEEEVVDSDEYVPLSFMVEEEQARKEAQMLAAQAEDAAAAEDAADRAEDAAEEVAAAAEEAQEAADEAHDAAAQQSGDVEE